MARVYVKKILLPIVSQTCEFIDSTHIAGNCGSVTVLLMVKIQFLRRVPLTFAGVHFFDGDFICQCVHGLSVFK